MQAEDIEREVDHGADGFEGDARALMPCIGRLSEMARLKHMPNDVTERNRGDDRAVVTSTQSSDERINASGVYLRVPLGERRATRLEICIAGRLPRRK